MIRSIVLWLFHFSVRQITAVPWPRLLTGLGSSGLLLSLLQQDLAQLGTTPLVTGIACGIVAMAWAHAWSFRRKTSTDDASKHRTEWVLPVVLCGLAAICPWLWTLHDRLFSETIMGSPFLLTAYLAGWLLITLGLPVWCVARMAVVETLGATTGSPAATRGTAPDAACIFGIAAGAAVWLLFGVGNLANTAVFAGVMLLAGQVWGAFKPTVCRTPPAEFHTDRVTGFAPLSTTRIIGAIVLAMAAGGLCCWTWQLTEMLFPATLYTWTAVGSGALLGFACSCRSTRRAPASLPANDLFACCCLTVALLMASAGFSEVVFRVITLTVSVSQVWMLHASRWALIAACTGPAGFLWGSAVSRLAEREDATRATGNRYAWGAGVLLAWGGACVTQSMLIPAAGFTAACYVLLWTIASLQAVELIVSRCLPRWSAIRVLCTACLAALIIAPAVSSGVKPELAGRLLFSANVFHAQRTGTPRAELPFLDEVRLEAKRTGLQSTYTVWKSAVARHQVRNNGIPRGTISTNTATCPQDSAEVVLSLLPLTLHERPSRVAVLGLGAGTPLLTCLDCPILELTAVESDPHLLSLIQQITAETEFGDYWQDERLKVKLADPVLWVLGSRAEYDVVISNPDSSAVLPGAPHFTEEFYRRVARRLSPDGIFCQRFQYHDYGAAPLRSMAATLKAVFGHVMAVEIGPGEMAWMATNSPQALIRPELIDRMQAEHVGQLLSTVGWDWSILLTLGAYDDAGLAKIVGDHSPLRNTAASGRIWAQLPSELMRWGNKAQEIQKSITVHADKILSWTGEAGTDEDLLRRLGEVRGQQELVAKYPDQFWGYRSQVRKQIASRPISRIQQIKHDDAAGGNHGGLHPDDKRRLKYFQQLSKAIHSEDVGELIKLTEYAAPYDPLISLFVHQEIAEIAARNADIPANWELTNRLHMLYFAPNSDTSVRNGLSALRLVLEQPDCLSAGQGRWDVINALLQVLQARWEMRSPEQMGSNAHLVIQDIDKNIVLTERALQELPDLSAEVGLTPAEWLARKHSIERRLLGPLRDYRERLQPIAAKQRMETQAAEVDGDLPTEEELQYPGADRD